MGNGHRGRGTVLSRSLFVDEHGLYVFEGEPFCSFEFVFIDTDGRGKCFAEESNHERVRKRPRLRGVISTSSYLDASLFEDLSVLPEGGERGDREGGE